MQHARLLAGALIVFATLVGMPCFAQAQPVPGCPLIPIPDAASIADPDREKLPYPPPAPLRITAIERTNVNNTVGVAGLGNVDAGYCLYSPPLHPAPFAPKKGLLLYNHGFQFGEIGSVDAMLQFIANSGYYVVYPYIPFSFTTQTLEAFSREYQIYPTLALSALRHALTRLQQQQVVIEHVAVAGHSLGGIAAVRVAAMWAAQNESPAIRAIVLHDPSGVTQLEGQAFHLNFGVGANLWGLTKTDLGAISCQTYLQIILAETSEADPASAAKLIWNNLPQISRHAPSMFAPRYRRNLLLVRHDVSHATVVTRKSDHMTVVASPWYRVYPDLPGPGPFPLTSMDYYGYWRPLRGALDMLSIPLSVDPVYDPFCNTSSTATTCATTRFMGKWGDNVNATEMKNAAEISGLTAMFPDVCP